MKLKTLTSLIVLTIGCMELSSTTIYTEIWSGGMVKKVVALVQTDYEIQAVTYQFKPELQDDVLILPMVRYEAIKVNSDVPSILLGTEIRNFSQEMDVLYVAGIKANELDYSRNNGWLKSRWLGWINIASYPMVFSQEDGWLYVEEVQEESFAIYSYDRGLWSIRNLKDEWPFIIEFKP